MSFLIGKTNVNSNVNSATEGLDKGLIDWIKQQGFGGLMPGTQVNPADAKPYQDMFQQQNALNLGQAKESAGNLTGSGVANAIGNTAARANVEQGSFLANLFENRRQQDASRFLNLVLGTLGSPAGGVTRTHQPGLLEEAGGLAAKAAPFLIPGAGAAAGVAGGLNAAQSMAANGFGVTPPDSLSYTPPGNFVAGPGQLGQASRYNFDGTHIDRLNSGQGSAYRGFLDPRYRDHFGTP